MPSRRPVLVDIKTYGLDPTKAHVLGKNGRLAKKDTSKVVHNEKLETHEVIENESQEVTTQDNVSQDEVVVEAPVPEAVDTVSEPIVAKVPNKKGKKKSAA